jgi:RNA polymerase sigma-70 factor (ECF subfamily)
MLPGVAQRVDDKVLMVRYRNGDMGAFETLYANHKGPLYRYFLRQGLERENASELFQEVWAKIIRARDRYEPTAKFTTYMYQLAHNCVVDYQRRQSRRPQHTASVAAIDPAELAANSADGPESGAQSMQILEQFQHALAALPFEQKEAFLLREEGGLSLSEIASVTRVSAETAKSRLRYAVIKLRKILGDNSVVE